MEIVVWFKPTKPVLIFVRNEINYAESSKCGTCEDLWGKQVNRV